MPLCTHGSKKGIPPMVKMIPKQSFLNFYPCMFIMYQSGSVVFIIVVPVLFLLTLCIPLAN